MNIDANDLNYSNEGDEQTLEFQHVSNIDKLLVCCFLIGGFSQNYSNRIIRCYLNEKRVQEKMSMGHISSINKKYTSIENIRNTGYAEAGKELA